MAGLFFFLVFTIKILQNQNLQINVFIQLAMLLGAAWCVATGGTKNICFASKHISVSRNISQGTMKSKLYICMHEELSSMSAWPREETK